MDRAGFLSLVSVLGRAFSVRGFVFSRPVSGSTFLLVCLFRFEFNGFVLVVYQDLVRNQCLFLAGLFSCSFGSV